MTLYRQIVVLVLMLEFFACETGFTQDKLIPFENQERIFEPRFNQNSGGMFGAMDGVVSSNFGPDELSGLDISDITGANVLHSAGYTGTRATILIVEGGHMWELHNTLGRVNQFFDARDTYIERNLDFGSLGEYHRHATWVGHDAGGYNPNENPYELGVAYGASLWSGALATEYNGEPYTGSWGWSRGYAYTDVFSIPILQGVDGIKADVVNFSWGFTSSSDESIQGGNNIFAVTLDGIICESGVTAVGIAGNEGPGINSIRMPSNGYNSICVGAVGDDLALNPYSEITEFSSRGPQLYSGPDGNFGIVRARVDIAAPGQNLTLAFYGGTTGGNAGGKDPTNGSTNYYSYNAAGTSFASPTVAGAAALLADVAYDRFPTNAGRARNGQVIKTVLLNSASKPIGWDNGQDSDFPVSTSQALDYAYGAGLLNLAEAFEQFTGGITDLPGDTPGPISPTGWDFGVLYQDTVHDYLINQELVAGTDFTATLNWFVGRRWIGTADNGAISSVNEYFNDLSLEFYEYDSNQIGDLVAISDAKFINTEHFHIQIPKSGRYMLRVAWRGERYDFVENEQQSYGLAWSGTGTPLLGDIDRDGMVSLLDVAPFVEILTTQTFQVEADVNQDNQVNLLDVAPFVDLLVGN